MLWWSGLPLLGFIVWARLPGHVAAPFEPAMLRPAATFFLAGAVAYFAGMLTGLRQARWFGSRALGLGLAVLVLWRIGWMTAFWQSLVLLFIAEGISNRGGLGQGSEATVITRASQLGARRP